MAGTAAPPNFAGYRNTVTDLMESGEPFGQVEDAIESADLGEDMKDALWLFAFFRRESGD